MFTLGDQAVASVTNFATTVIIGRMCMKEELGLYMLGFSILLFATTLQSAIILIPYSVYYPRSKEAERVVYTGSTFAQQLLLSALTVLCLIVATAYVSYASNTKGLASVMLALTVAITFILFREYVRQISFAQLKVKATFFLDTIIAIAQIGGLLVFAYQGRLSASLAYLVSGTACCMAAGGWLITFRRKFKLQPAKITLHIRQHLSFGKWLLAGSIVYILSMQIYPWLLTGFHGTGATGILAACMGTIFLANPFMIGMGNYLGPKISHDFADGGIEKLKNTVIRSTILFAVVMGLFSILMLIFGGQIIAMVYGKQYSGTGAIVGVLALSQLASALTFPLNYGLLAMGRPDVGFKSYLIALLAMLAVGVWLVKAFGPFGASCGLLAGNSVASLFRWMSFRREINSAALPEEKPGI